MTDTRETTAQKPTAQKPKAQKPLFRLIADLPGQLIALGKAELNHFKAELVEKLKHAGIGIGLFVAAALFAYFAVATLIAAAVLGIAVALPAWLAALIVAAALLLVTGILAWAGAASFKKMNGVAPRQTIENVKLDTEAIKGMGPYDN